MEPEVLTKFKQLYKCERVQDLDPVEESEFEHPGMEPGTVWGEITASFCETCPVNKVENPPAAVCHDCDQDGLVCPQCCDEGASWENEKLKHLSADQGEMVEVSGVQLDTECSKDFPNR